MEKEMLLIVDDDPLVTEALAMALEGERWTVMTCHDIEAAEMILDHFPVSNVLLDVQYSGRFGFEGLKFIEMVRLSGRTVNIIVMTGNACQDLRDETLTRGVGGYLQKPFSLDELEPLLVNREVGHAAINC